MGILRPASAVASTAATKALRGHLERDSALLLCPLVWMGRWLGNRFFYAKRGFPDDVRKINAKGVRDPQQGVNGGEALLLFHPHDHRMAEPRPFGHFILRETLPQALLAQRSGDLGSDGLG